MRNKMIFRLSILLTLVFVVCVYFVYRLQMKSDPRETIWIPEPGSVNRLPPGDTEPGFRWVQPMGKGPWYKKPIEEKKPVVVESPVHEEPPEPLVPVSRDYTPVEVHIPEGITDPDVKKAWERVEYIADNIWEFGGVPAAETPELIN